MQRTVLQIPMTKQLRDQAEAVSSEMGFSSLQELLRVFMKKITLKKIDLSFEEEPTIRLSAKNEKRYLKITQDFEQGKNTFSASGVEDLMRQLHEN